MQLPDVFCCVFFMIAVMATCVEPDTVETNEVSQIPAEKKISKRDTLIVDEIHAYNQLPKVIYRRKAQSDKVVPLKPKYGPSRLKYKTVKPKSSRKPNKKPRYQKPYTSKYIPFTHKHRKRTSKPKHRSPMKLIPKPIYEIPKYGPPAYESAGFGEPPKEYEKHQPSKSYGEPPVDSYGEPLKHTTQAYPHWADQLDDYFAFSNKQLPYVNPDVDVMFDINNIHKPKYFTDNSKVVKKPWKIKNKEEDEEIVGGQYAEPPPRYVPRHKIQKKEQQGLSRYATSNNSPYINYKNSNIAFSPQNVNDAFSIVDTTHPN